MNEYLVVWEVITWAESAREAAKEAQAIQQSQHQAQKGVFKIITKGEDDKTSDEQITIDLGLKEED